MFPVSFPGTYKPLCSSKSREGPSSGDHQRIGDILLRNMRQLKVRQVNSGLAEKPAVSENSSLLSSVQCPPHISIPKNKFIFFSTVGSSPKRVLSTACTWPAHLAQDSLESKILLHCPLNKTLHLIAVFFSVVFSSNRCSSKQSPNNTVHLRVFLEGISFRADSSEHGSPRRLQLTRVSPH